jgi:ribosomal protein S18 acetylase RimI-like enzyme
LIIKRYDASDAGRVYAYWRSTGHDVPYFFDVSAKRWHRCLVEDEREGEQVFDLVETVLALAGDGVVGFVQYGKPNFAWDPDGQKVYAPHIGVVRQLYFERGRPDVGHALMAQAEPFLAEFGQSFAFYHALGMSCTASHGKLHSSLLHVEPVLRARGFGVEHENVYYCLDLSKVEAAGGEVQLEIARDAEGESFTAQVEGREIGSARVRFLDGLTGGRTRDVAYLDWIGLREEYRGRGFGNAFLRLLAEWLRDQGNAWLHTDTASDNTVAQRFYERQGFEKRGFTRSYIRTGGPTYIMPIE